MVDAQALPCAPPTCKAEVTAARSIPYQSLPCAACHVSGASSERKPLHGTRPSQTPTPAPPTLSSPLLLLSQGDYQQRSRQSGGGGRGRGGRWQGQDQPSYEAPKQGYGGGGQYLVPGEVPPLAEDPTGFEAPPGFDPLPGDHPASAESDRQQAAPAAGDAGWRAAAPAAQAAPAPQIYQPVETAVEYAGGGDSEEAGGSGHREAPPGCGGRGRRGGGSGAAGGRPTFVPGQRRPNELKLCHNFEEYGECHVYNCPYVHGKVGEGRANCWGWRRAYTV